MNNCIKNIRESVLGLRVVIYLRLSDEDENKLTKEQLSESIKNQELMLSNYCVEQGWTIVGVYNDEDWSGADKARPEFNKMIKECEKGNVDIVLCKTQARFARDSELIEKYIHDKFHEWGVRFQTVVDKIDNTKRETKKTSQILGLTDEWMLEDTSLNIRETFKTKRINGQWTGAFTPYGYLKDPENKNHLIVDKVASLIVKRIYKDFLNGKGLNKIVRELNTENILSPYEYKKLSGLKYNNPRINEFSNYESINVAGAYKVDINYTNNTGEVLHNFVTYNYISNDRKGFSNSINIRITKYNKDKQKVYYTKKKNFKINPMDFSEWIEIISDEVLPNDIECISVVTSELDRTHTIKYELELSLSKNTERKTYFFDVLGKADEPIIINDISYNIRKKFQWCEQTIKNILTDEVYIGNVAQFKTTTVSYKNHTIIKNPKDQWIRKEKMHEPIIDKKDWLLVQERCKNNLKSDSFGCTHPFQNKIVCSYCGKIFSKSGGKDINKCYFSCKDRRTRWNNCINKKHIRYVDFEKMIIDKINNLLDKYLDAKKFNEIRDNDIEKDEFSDALDGLYKEYGNIEKELQAKNMYFSKLYEDKIKGLLEDKEFLMLKDNYVSNSEKLENRLLSIKDEINNIIEKSKNFKVKKDILKKYTHINSLNNQIVDEFIDKVYVGVYDDEKKERSIKIVWNFAI